MSASAFLDVRLCDENLRLMADRALFWPGASLLCLSDVHLGKAETLQTLGLPIPSGEHFTDLYRLASLVRETECRRVLILGDLIHQKVGLTDEILAALEKFLKFFERIEFTLLFGNHERGARAILERLPWHCTDQSPVEGPFLFSHGDKDEDETARDTDRLMVRGHVHPVYSLSEGRTRMRFPCFWLTPTALTLPSFGTLTGGWHVKPSRSDRIFVTTGKEVFETRL